MKKFFLGQSKINIFFVIGIILIISDFFYTKYPIGLIGLLIACIPEIKNEIGCYKETGKWSFYLVAQGFVFIITIYIIVSTMLGI